MQNPVNEHIAGFDRVAIVWALTFSLFAFHAEHIIDGGWCVAVQLPQPIIGTLGILSIIGRRGTT